MTEYKIEIICPKLINQNNYSGPCKYCPNHNIDVCQKLFNKDYIEEKLNDKNKLILRRKK